MSFRSAGPGHSSSPVQALTGPPSDERCSSENRGLVPGSARAAPITLRGMPVAGSQSELSVKTMGRWSAAETWSSYGVERAGFQRPADTQQWPTPFCNFHFNRASSATGLTGTDPSLAFRGSEQRPFPPCRTVAPDAATESREYRVCLFPLDRKPASHRAYQRHCIPDGCYRSADRVGQAMQSDVPGLSDRVLCGNQSRP